MYFFLLTAKDIRVDRLVCRVVDGPYSKNHAVLSTATDATPDFSDRGGSIATRRLLSHVLISLCRPVHVAFVAWTHTSHNMRNKSGRGCTAFLVATCATRWRSFHL